MEFLKYEALGNDFLLIEAKGKAPTTRKIRHWLNRRQGAGADQLLWLETKGRDHFVRFFNQDGSEAEMCGNGLRAIAHFFAHFKNKPRAVVHTKKGLHALRKVGSQRFEVQLVKPEIKPIKRLFGKELHIVRVGNPHAICFVDTPKSLQEIETFGPRIERHPFFKEGTNVEWVYLESSTKARVRVWERGVGETPACGSGAGAVGASILSRTGKKTCSIHFPGGTLKVSFDQDKCLFLEGPATLIYAGALT